MKAGILFQTTRWAVRNALLYVGLAVLAVHLPVTVVGQPVYTTPYTFTTLAGLAGVSGTNDGTGSAAQFYAPSGIAVDGAGNAYVADGFSKTIRKVTSAGVVTTLAGQPGIAGTNDGVGSAAQFNLPWGVAVDANSNLYVADVGNNAIRKLTLVGTNWMVATIAGLPGVSGTNDGTNGGARFYAPAGVAVDGASIVYVADSGNYTIRKVTPVGTNWVVTTLAGRPGSYGDTDGTNSDARFGDPKGVAVDTNGNLYVADTENETIRELQPVGTNWVVNTLAGLAPYVGNIDGSGTNARFGGPLGGPTGVALDGAKNIYVTDGGNNSVRKVTPMGTDWVVSTLAGLPAGASGSDGTGSNAQFSLPRNIALDTNGNLYVTDSHNNTIRKGYPPGSVPAPALQPPSIRGGQFGFGITGLPNLAVDVQSSSDLANWQTVNGNYYVLVDGTNFFPGPNPPLGNQFYRVRVR